MSVMLVAGILLGTPAAAQDSTAEGQAPDGDATVEPEVLAELAEQDTTVFWVYLRDQTDLSAAPGIADRGAQGWFVYEQLTETATESQADLVAMLDAEEVEYESFWIANTIRVTGGADLLERIAAQPEVERITADREYELPEPIPAEDTPRVAAVEWGIDRINAPDVWDTFGITGEDIVVGSIDTGALYTHEALVSQYRGNLGGGEFDHNYNWHDPSNVCGSPSLEPCDNNGHGTHVTGTMVGDDGADNQIGVAPGATWIAAKGCESASCSQSALLSSGQFILAPTDLEGENPDPELRPHIVNNSWGGGADTDPWYRPTVQAWVAAGIFPQFASGNPGSGCGLASNPGNLPESYAAGAFDINDNIASFSGRGPSAWGGDIIKPNLAAPGVAVRSAWNDGGYNTISGTSMASPHVSGAVALMWAAAIAIERDIDATRELLDMTAIDTEDLQCGGEPDNNNVWGQGRLDAFAAVDESPRGPTGLLEGTVTDAETGDPIAAATITITGEVDREHTTGADGTYGITLPVGDYEVTASAFGYASQTASVTIAEDETTVQDLPLETVDNVTVTGQITDGSGHGWPMYAKVSVAGTPLETFTDPVSGEYSVTLPIDGTYTFVVESQYPGYDDTSETVEVGDSDVTLDLTLIVDRCEAAPGYEFSGTVGVLGDDSGDPLVDFLDDAGIPGTAVTWSDDLAGFDVIVVNRPGNPGEAEFLEFLGLTDAEGTGVVFLDTWSTLGNGIWLLWTHTGNPETRSTGFSSGIPYLYYEVVEEHPILEGFEVGDEIVFDEASTFKDHAWFGGYAGDDRMVIADAGRADTGIVGNGIGVQERENNRHALLSMHASGSFTGPRFWTDDAGELFLNALEWSAPEAGFECELIEGGLVLGHVTDANTGDGVNGATVASDGNPDDRGTSFATPQDPALDDGFYWLFSSLTGSQQFTASAPNYASLTETVDVVADTTNPAEFVLPAGQLTVDPTEVEATLRLGQSANRTFTITNTGTASAQVELFERRGSSEILGGQTPPAPSGAEVEEITGLFTPAAAPERDVPIDTEASVEPRPAAPPWESIADYPQNIMDNAAVWVDDRVYSFGGWFGTPQSTAFAFDPATDEWSAIANLPGARQRPGVAEIDGLIYVVGGWPDPPVATTLIYDPASDSWSQGADMPAGRSAPGVAVVDGQLYVIGGCIDGACNTSNTVWRYDPGADQWQTLADYPESTAWLGCGGVEGAVVCTGGTDGAATRTSTFSYDPGSDSWMQRADLPYDNWAMAAAPASGQLVVSGGVTNGFATVTNRSAAYDPGGDSWTEIEPANQAVYRSGGACGFYRVGGSTSGFTPVAASEVHPEFDECLVDVDVPWMDIHPTTATLQPGDSVTVTVSVDSDATEEGQPGTYTAGVRVAHDTPYAVDPVGVTMNVTPPNNWGKIAGTVTGVDCQGNPSPLAGATVQINGGLDQVTLATDAAGGYAYWLSVQNNPLQLIVSANGFVPQIENARLRPRQTVAVDFMLQAVCPSGGADHLPD